MTKDIFPSAQYHDRPLSFLLRKKERGLEFPPAQKKEYGNEQLVLKIKRI